LKNRAGYSNLGVKKVEQISREKIKSYFEAIRSSGYRLMNLLNDILDLSKLESGTTEFEFVRTKLSGPILTAIEEF
jgi:signal transduction histidine kinase